MQTLYLLNPLSNEGRAPQMWEKLRKKHKELPKEFVDITKIADLTKYLDTKRPDLVVIAGGDGTINSVCYSVLNSKHNPPLAVLPFGFGNAISFCLGVETPEKALHVIEKQERKVAIDIFQTNIPEHPIGFFNISVGFDARIVYNRMNFRYIGFRSYILSALRSFFFHKENAIKFTVNNTTFEATASSLMIANTPVLGQNILAAEDAKLNDGLLDCTLFSTKYDYLRNLRLKGFKHPLYTKMGKVHFKTTKIRVDGEPFIQIDGDPLILKHPLEVEIFPSKITFLRNTSEHIESTRRAFL